MIGGIRGHPFGALVAPAPPDLLSAGIDEPSALTKVIGQVAKTGSQRKGKALAIYVPSDSTNTMTVCANPQKK